MNPKSDQTAETAEQVPEAQTAAQANVEDGHEVGAESPEAGGEATAFNEEEFAVEFHEVAAQMIPRSILEHSRSCENCGEKYRQLLARATIIKKATGTFTVENLQEIMDDAQTEEFEGRAEDGTNPVLFAKGPDGSSVILAMDEGKQYVVVTSPSQRGVIIFRGLDRDNPEDQAVSDRLYDVAMKTLQEEVQSQTQDMLLSLLRSGSRRRRTRHPLEDLFEIIGRG
jgi:hypothetical protein